MTMMFGRFDIQSELSKSDTALIYKATDTETNQTVALKTQSLEPLGEKASAFVDALIAEGESTRDLASQNIAVLYGAGEIEGQFCAAMEYVQGNSVATMLNRKEGFSIWDLLDITRQVCAGLDYAASKGVVHYSLEPSKVMVQWDGMVKILGYGISSMGLIAAESGNGLGRLLPYVSPEQVRGDAIDLRSNIFTWGAVLYEMVTERKAFDATDPAALATQIANDVPPNPSSVNPKIQAGVSALIMKAIAKDPAERYQSARELANDLEKCKEGGRKAAASDVKKPAVAKAAVSPQARAAAASKFVASAPKTVESDLSDEWAPPQKITAPRVPAAPPRPEPRASAAAAGVGSGSHTSYSPAPESGSRVIDDAVSEHDDSRHTPAIMNSAVAAEPEAETPASGVAVDPMMAAPAVTGSGGRSFSDLDELPPMKEPVFAPPPPPLPVPDMPESSPLAQIRRNEEKPKIQPREAAEKAIKEIKTVPPALMMYSILGAVVLILVVAVAVFFHVRSQDEDTTAAPRPTKPVASQPQEPPADTSTTTPAPAAVPAQVAAPEPEPEPEVSVRQIERKAPPRKRVAAPAIVPGAVQIDSTPEGAQVHIDGRTDSAWVTPFSLGGIVPGAHTISLSKSGYTPETRSVEVASGSKAVASIRLSPLNGLLVVNSTPTGAEILLDGKNTGKVTPAQFAVEKGSHTLLLRKQGFLEETASAELGPGQNFQFAPALRALGNADEIRSVGKLKKLFGGGNDSVAGMGTVSVRTQPKGAQIAINRKLLDKNSPTEFMVGPGNYIVDVTLTGFKPVHKVITVEKGGKVAIDEVLDRE